MANQVKDVLRGDTMTGAIYTSHLRNTTYDIVNINADNLLELLVG